MNKISITEKSHELLLPLLTSESVVIDATCGNGYDTLFLAKHARVVHAFDIQEIAIKQTKELTKDFDNVSFHLESHAHITDRVLFYDGVIFNLGYLPGGNEKITTKYQTTIEALEKLHEKRQGFILVVVYPGHLEGVKESVAVQSFLDRHDIKYELIKLPYETKSEAPYILFWRY